MPGLGVVPAASCYLERCQNAQQVAMHCGNSVVASVFAGEVHLTKHCNGCRVAHRYMPSIRTWGCSRCSPPTKTHCSCFLCTQVRERELELIRKTAVVKTLNLCLVFAVPPVIALVIFATYAYSVGPLTSSMAFVVLSLFNTLRFPLVVLPKALRGASGQQQQVYQSHCVHSSQACPTDVAATCSIESLQRAGCGVVWLPRVPDCNVANHAAGWHPCQILAIHLPAYTSSVVQQLPCSSSTAHAASHGLRWLLCGVCCAMQRRLLPCVGFRHS